MKENYTERYMTLMDKIGEYGIKRFRQGYDLAQGRKTNKSENESGDIYEEISHEIMKLVYFHQHKVEMR